MATALPRLKRSHQGITLKYLHVRRKWRAHAYIRWLISLYVHASLKVGQATRARCNIVTLTVWDGCLYSNVIVTGLSGLMSQLARIILQKMLLATIWTGVCPHVCYTYILTHCIYRNIRSIHRCVTRQSRYTAPTESPTQSSDIKHVSGAGRGSIAPRTLASSGWWRPGRLAWWRPVCNGALRCAWRVSVRVAVPTPLGIPLPGRPELPPWIGPPRRIAPVRTAPNPHAGLGVSPCSAQSQELLKDTSVHVELHSTKTEADLLLSDSQVTRLSSKQQLRWLQTRKPLAYRETTWMKPRSPHHLRSLLSHK